MTLRSTHTTLFLYEMSTIVCSVNLVLSGHCCTAGFIIGNGLCMDNRTFEKDLQKKIQKLSHLSVVDTKRLALMGIQNLCDWMVYHELLACDLTHCLGLNTIIG